MVHIATVRSDAARNRAAIITAARELIARDGLGVSMDDIAAAANVAVGTLYRHHASKEDLIDAVVRHSVKQIAQAAESANARVEGGAAADGELAALIRFVGERHAADSMNKRIAVQIGRHHATVELSAPDTAGERTPERRAWNAVGTLLRSAQRTGRIRADLELTHLAALLGGTPGNDAEPGVLGVYLDVVLAGIRTPTDDPPRPA
jgi:AcrR family transcriptional regulator